MEGCGLNKRRYRLCISTSKHKCRDTHFRALAIFAFFFFSISGCLWQQNTVGIAAILFITAVSHHCNYQQQ